MGTPPTIQKKSIGGNDQFLKGCDVKSAIPGKLFDGEI